MKKYILLLLSVLTAAWLSSCGSFYSDDIDPEDPKDWPREWARDHKDYEDQKQMLEIYSSEGELKYVTTDNEQIFYCVKNMRLEHWDYDAVIPSSSRQLLSTIGYKIINGKMQPLSRDIIFVDGDDYYCLSETLPSAGITGTFEAGVPREYAKYYMELAGIRP